MDSTPKKGHIEDEMFKILQVSADRVRFTRDVTLNTFDRCRIVTSSFFYIFSLTIDRESLIPRLGILLRTSIVGLSRLSVIARSISYCALPHF